MYVPVATLPEVAGLEKLSKPPLINVGGVAGQAVVFSCAEILAGIASARFGSEIEEFATIQHAARAVSIFSATFRSKTTPSDI